MEKQALKDLIYGGIEELMHNRRYYHVSTIGREYCRWTEEGRAQLDTFMTIMTQLVYEAEQKDLDTRSKEIMLKELAS